MSLPDRSIRGSCHSIIKLTNVTKTYSEPHRQNVIFQHLDLGIDPGEFVVLLGRSGSGKSTLLNLISGIDLPTDGEITIDGACVSRLSEQDRTLFRRHHIGFVFQSYNLIPTLTVEENLLLPLELKQKITPEVRRHALALLEELGLGGREPSYPDRLSGGEQQRVAIGRALVHEPMLVLADEPTGNLDLETAHEVLDILEHTVRGSNKTLVMVTHSTEIAGRADRILTIHNGQLTTEKADDLSTQPSRRQIS